MTEATDEDLSAVWAGQLELRLKRDTPEYSRGFRGAYTTVLVRCTDAARFVEAASEHVGQEGFVIGGIEKLFPLAAGQLEITEGMADLVERTRQYPVQWTTFHMFKDDA